jgi:hypothetical protein
LDPRDQVTSLSLAIGKTMPRITFLNVIL